MTDRPRRIEEGRDDVARRLAPGDGPAELLRLHDELDLLAPRRAGLERVRDSVIMGLAAYASWMIVATAADLGTVWPFALGLAAGWSISLGITVTRRLRIRTLRRRIQALEEGGGGTDPSTLSTGGPGP